jgi:hypothetical protein
VWEASPYVLKAPFQFISFTALYLPKKLSTVLVNLFMLKIGASKNTVALLKKFKMKSYIIKKEFKISLK